jgi:hypothetical protein
MQVNAIIVERLIRQIADELSTQRLKVEQLQRIIREGNGEVKPETLQNFSEFCGAKEATVQTGIEFAQFVGDAMELTGLTEIMIPTFEYILGELCAAVTPTPAIAHPPVVDYHADEQLAARLNQEEMDAALAQRLRERERLEAAIAQSRAMGDEFLPEPTRRVDDLEKKNYALIARFLAEDAATARQPAAQQAPAVSQASTVSPMRKKESPHDLYRRALEEQALVAREERKTRCRDAKESNPLASRHQVVPFHPQATYNVSPGCNFYGDVPPLEGHHL